MISPQNVSHVPVTEGTLITRMPFEPGAGAMLSGEPLSASAEALFAPHAGATHTMAPASILVGGDAAKEQSLHGLHLTHQPLRVRLGTTLGGHYAVGGAVGEFRGDAFSGAPGPKGAHGARGPEYSRGAGAGGPVILSHGQQSSASPRSGGGGGTVSSGGGSYGTSAPASTSSMSAGHAASSSGGHH